MATSSNPSTQTREEQIRDKLDELPDDRSYDDQEISELDSALEDALEAAEDADHEYLSHLLECELASLYYEQKLGV